VTEGATIMRVHKDVWDLAVTLVEQDRDKLRRAAPALFAPDVHTWFDIETGEGRIGFYFQGHQGSITTGDTLLWMQRSEEPDPLLVPCWLDLPGRRLALGYSPRSKERLPMTVKDHGIDPILGNRLLSQILDPLLAVMALVNSPKVVKSDFVDLARINKKRAALGRYTFHPHHTVKLNVDKKTVRTTAGQGDGGSKALHMVRAHLRLVNDHYVLVSPHWRGDPAIGIRSTSYEAGRNNSRWRD
jgi:hypothetical protein